MTARDKDRAVALMIERRCQMLLDFSTVRDLRRIERTLHAWAEGECGDANGTAIERDEITGKPQRTYFGNDGKRHGYSIPDREKGALKRCAALCKRYGLHFYHQTDPRGCVLYVSTEPLTDTNYTNGVAVCA